VPSAYRVAGGNATLEAVAGAVAVARLCCELPAQSAVDPPRRLGLLAKARVSAAGAQRA